MARINFVLDYFNIGEKDLVMLFFFVAIMVSIAVYEMLHAIYKNVKANREDIRIDLVYMAKVLFIPVLLVVLSAKGASKKTRRRAVNAFLYC